MSDRDARRAIRGGCVSTSSSAAMRDHPTKMRACIAKRRTLDSHIERRVHDLRALFSQFEK
jgi:hypothetical protein